MSSTVLLIQEDVEAGAKKDDSSDIENDFFYKNNVRNADINIRMGFLRKVYGLLSMQLLITVSIVAVSMLCEPFQLFVRENSWTALSSFLLTIGILVALYIKRKQHPANLVLLVLFTVVQAYTVAIAVSMYDTTIVLEALIVTLTILIGLTTYTLQSKRDFSFLGFGLFTGLWILLIGSFMHIFLQSSAFDLFLSIGGALLFCLFIVFDTHQIMQTLSPEEYVLATINIYLDVINLFLYILRIFAAAKQ